MEMAMLLFLPCQDTSVF